jgi:GlpG protein
MRQVGVIASRELAQRFEGYLLTLGIGSQVREHREGFAVWVFDEDSIRRAESEFGTFREQPEDARFREADKARALKVAEEQARATAPAREVTMPRTWAQAPALFNTPVTLGLLMVSVMLTLWAQFGESLAAREMLLMTATTFRGEPWRAISPIFLHYGAMHLVFNMLWLKDLGGQIETLKGRVFLGGLVVALAVLSNSAQYFATGPGFGGMSGVVYGLFGYIWIKSKREPWSGFIIDQQTVWLMLAWFALCFTGWFGPVANLVHAGGLAVGVVLALIPGKRP